MIGRSSSLNAVPSVGSENWNIWAYLPEGADETGEAHDATVGKQLSHLGDPPDVLLAILVGETEILVEPVPDVVPVEAVSRDAMSHQVLLQRKGNRRLSSSRQSCRVNTNTFSASKNTL